MKQFFKWIALMVVLASTLNVSANRTLDFKSGKISSGDESVMPTRTVTTKSDTTIVTYSFVNAHLISDGVHLGCYNWEIAGFSNNNEIGESAYPFIIDSFEIPEGKNPVLTYIGLDQKSFSFPMSPARAPKWSHIPKIPSHFKFLQYKPTTLFP